MAASLRTALTAPFVVLCEGEADHAFLGVLRERRGLGPFDLPFPPASPPPDEPPLYGFDGFVNMLHRIAAEGRLDLTLWSRLRGIIAVADAGDRPPGRLQRFATFCATAGFGAPAAVGQWTPSPPPLPPVALVLVPIRGKGGLETVCLEYLRSLHADAARCLDAYLACLPPLRRSAEKRDKAALACLTAGIDRSNPTRALKMTFSGTPPLIDVTDPRFTPFATVLGALLGAVPPR